MEQQEPKPKHPGGRPRMFKTPEEMEEKISQYFIDGCRTKKVFVKVGKDDYVEKEVKIPTISGLALYLGFSDRNSMYDYENDFPEFTSTIKRARAFITQEYEEMLRENPSGAIFALKNFGWSDKQEVETKNINLNMETNVTPETLAQAMLDVKNLLN